MSMLPLSERYSDFKFPPDPFPGRLLLDHEAIIGVPVYDNITQYAVCGFVGRGEPCTLNYAMLVFDGEVTEPIDATMYLVQESLNRTIARHHWTIAPGTKTHRITHTVGRYMDEAHKYLLHFHLKEGQTIEGYFHACISTT